MAARSKAWVCRRSLAGIAGSNPTGDMDVFLLYVCILIVRVCNCWHSSATLTEVFPCLFLSSNANARVKPAMRGHGPHSSKIFV